MDKRYQVFVSSTFADLQSERRKVIQALMEMDCIPAGMELFPAADEEQWQFIRRVIDDCDYYILIIGGRYGSLTPEGISYTEQEYDYAISIGIKVLAFIHAAPDEIPVGKSDLDPSVHKKLDAFRQRVSRGRLVKFWRKADELPGLVALSLTKTVKLYPAIGWVRANAVSNDQLLVDINELRKDNQQLRKKLDELESMQPMIFDQLELAGLDESQIVALQYTERDWHYESRTRRETISQTWSEIFAIISPDLLQNPSDGSVNFKLGSALYRKLHPDSERIVEVHHDSFQTIKVQLLALGLINVSYSPTTKGDMALFWTLTPRGQGLMIQLRAVKAAPQNPA